MRRVIVCILMQIAFFGIVNGQVHTNVDVSVNFSFNELNSYGEWVSVTGYGQVWRPYVGPDWRPFMYGRWMWTSNDGWMWDSYEPFGWVVCHYGFWYYDDDWGWVWIPGYEWSPARVQWHVTDLEIGWLPLFPTPLPGRPHPHVQWSFCPVGMFTDVEIHNHIVVRPQSSSTVVVRRGPPQITVVRKRARVPVVTESPRRVTVQSNQRAFVRVESSASARKVVVPVGPQFRQERKVRPGVIVNKNVEQHPQQQRPTETSVKKVEPQQQGHSTVTVNPQPKVVRPAQSDGENIEVRTQPYEHDKQKVRVESRNDNNTYVRPDERKNKVQVKKKK